MKKYIEITTVISPYNHLTYFKLKRHERFDWYKALKLAIDPGQEEAHIMDIRGDLAMLSANWVTCACGNQCDIIPRQSNGAPVDKKLREEGSLFTTLVEEEKYSEALECLDRIEKRSAELIAQINKSGSFKD